MVFDVDMGRETSGKSKSNQAEADMAVALFWELRSSMAEEVHRRVRVRLELHLDTLIP